MPIPVIPAPTLAMLLSGLPRSLTVPSQVGGLCSVSRLLGSASTLALTSASSSNLQLSGTTISGVAAISYGVSQTAQVRETITTGAGKTLAVEYPVVLTGGLSAPVAPTLGTPVAGNGTLTIPWTDNATGGAAIDTRWYTIGTTSGGEGALTSASLTGGNLVLTGLTNGQAYFVKGYNHNSAGYSLASGEVTGSPVARPTNAIRNSTNTGYVRSLSGGYATMGAPVYV